MMEVWGCHAVSVWRGFSRGFDVVGLSRCDDQRRVQRRNGVPALNGPVVIAAR